ncbi:nucleotidyltransferase family protein [Fictibacillus terranigra]|uniref:Nucleotidyltransferase family protein n=1 Tax=Fictibacillus terranigra TaxID=3058424 RepID=A0ABT8E7R5_9BACL|nr:nucleotidyltransferase family protein [Fictibacillus sp. CENA-BCM004]MDN4073942.1 nucleotidyltransferase family protein [Fictibacillus sp. CENA-BCM004]
MSSSTPSLSAIVLGAGRSSRMRTLKALLPWKGTSLIRFQTETLLNAGISDIVVVLGFRAADLSNELSSYTIKTVMNKDYHSGKCSSIKAGLAAITQPSSGVIICAVDQPLSLNVVRNLYKLHTKHPAAIILPSFKGKRGHPLLIPKSLYDDLQDIKEQTQGLRHLVNTRRKEIVTVELDEPSILLNLNEQADYQEACWEDS